MKIVRRIVTAVAVTAFGVGMAASSGPAQADTSWGTSDTSWGTIQNPFGATDTSWGT